MHSALYSGWVQHRRFAPKTHAFRYRMGLLYLDLDEQDTVLGLSRLAGRGRFAPFAFRETDFLPAFTGAGMRLIDAVRQRVGEALGQVPQGRICLLTQPRSWGLAFNPASFFYCFDKQDRLQAILCEVSNTPWRERYHYVLPATGEGHQHMGVAKSFHVSPFLPRELEYRMGFSQPGERLGIHMADWAGETKVFDASLSLTRTALDRASLHRYLLSFPWMTGKTVVGIYWQALRLLLKRVPVFNHEAADGEFRAGRPESKDVHHEKL
ncbi:MAG: DUF1365 domain-containing protein [Gammaproteobacteria bacterium]|nr:DUF1365 domain-containing protein [Gammaproteobacteria bacterium]MBU1490011.1 DUF1365 domain-containing protein [Gammaproteobacteria bacterium]MBU2064306.1 DUF1365 domain-containing protein [Gammaproteobacteria bacterium]MBU2137942.1 DUF1365 domain-containing protein [Gammaproteobacteria bacterium]MBU2218165.1 DUF1365 domain-containing protein [Gammaproteobacteria bacterium]